MNLRDFLTDVDQLIDDAITDSDFHPTQRDLLEHTVQRYRPLSLANPLADPLWRSTFYLVARACGRVIDKQAKQLAAFCSLYLLAADLMDDVQDDDLAGKPHELAGPAIATNNSVALLFLALRFLEQVTALEPRQQHKQAYFQLFNRTSLLAVAGQHRDLLGAEGALLPIDVLDMLRARNSSLSMIVECGALLGGCDEQQRALYREMGEKIIIYGQVREDLSDIFGKAVSPDLGTGKITYPIACFLEDATQESREHFHELLSGLPGTLREVRAVLYHSGAVQRAANTMEGLREDIHTLIASTNNSSSYLRCLVCIVDGFAESIYSPPPVESTRSLFEPSGPWHDWVRHNLILFMDRMKPHTPPPAPTLRPWHMPQWLYEPNKNIIYYPDVEGLGEEILPTQAEWLGIDNLDEVSRILWEQVPAMLAHEMFHYWRDAAGRMSIDHWHEEWAANTLAVAYAGQFEPAVLSASSELAGRVTAQFQGLLGESAQSLLASCHEARPDEHQYHDMPMQQMIVVTLEMIGRLAQQMPQLHDAVSILLDSERTLFAEVAA